MNRRSRVFSPRFAEHADMFAAFVNAYENRLIEVIGEHVPYFFAFRRILMWGRRGD